MLKLVLSVFCFVLICAHESAFSYVVLLDPGHGGDEVGAVGKIQNKRIYEKNLTLDLSKKIKSYLPDNITSYLTRSFDRDVDLNERAQMASKVKADLFVSIHFNSAKDKRANGFEVYYLDNHDDLAIKKVEDVENKNLDQNEIVINQILIDLVISKTVNGSRTFANYVLKEIDSGAGRKYKLKNRGVRPGLFYVLALSKRPGILIEVGFMSNQKELKKLNNNDFLDSYAKSIALGIENYIKTLPPKDLNFF